jgi:uncharacterized membrane protein
MNLKKIMGFDSMITPVLIKILFWIGVIGSILGGLIIFIALLAGGFRNGGFGPILGGLAGGFFGGLLYSALGILWARIVCELLILAFRIHETLVDIKESLVKE